MTTAIEIKDLVPLITDLSKTATERFTAIEAKQAEHGALILDTAQKVARRPEGPGGFGQGDGPTKALQDLLEKSEGLASLRNGHKGRVTLDLPPGYLEHKATLVSTGIVMPEAQAGIATPVARRMTIRGLLNAIPVGGPIQYLQETAFTNAAAPVAEAALKPESGMTFVMKTGGISVIAHWIRTSEQAIDDVPQLMQHIDQRLRYGLQFAEEVQLLLGTAGDPNLAGLMPGATAYVPPGTPPTGYGPLDQIRLAIAQLAAGEYQASGVVLNPADWAAIELIRDGNQRFVTGQPRGANPASLWGLPVVATTAMTAKSFLVGDFSAVGMLLDRMQAVVQISVEDADNFTHNLCTIRGEERVGLAVIRPGAMVKGTFA